MAWGHGWWLRNAPVRSRSSYNCIQSYIKTWSCTGPDLHRPPTVARSPALSAALSNTALNSEAMAHPVLSASDERQRIDATVGCSPAWEGFGHCYVSFVPTCTVTMPAYCTTTLQGDKCTDPRCPYLHHIFRCEPCGRSFPAPLLNQHESGSFHRQNIANLASYGPTNPSTSQHLRPSPPQPAPPSPQPAPPNSVSPQSGSDSPIPVPDPLGRVIVSREDGLDFEVVGVGAAADPPFDPISGIISIEKTSVVSSLSIQSMTLLPSPNPWCE